MKKTRIFLFSLILTLLFSAAVFAQKDAAPTLAPDANLADTEAWLLKTIGKNSTYHLGPTKKSITDLKFDGCSVGFTMRAETYQAGDGALPTDSGEDSNDLSSKASGGDDELGLGRNGAATVSFSLADMNSAAVAVAAARDSNKMKTVGIEGLPGKNPVTVGAKGRSSKTVQRSAIMLTVKDTVADPIKSGLIQAIKLCQAPK